MTVEYGSDLDTHKYGSGFPLAEKDHKLAASLPCDFESRDFYKYTGWNLNNLPHYLGSILRHIKGNYNGINVPWLYVGMLFATFAWHNEDNYLYSISYNHYGATKVWHGVSGDQANKLETCMRNFLMERFKEVPDLMYHLVTMIGPSMLLSKGVKVVKAYQEPGQFVVTFPQAYHGGFSLGFNVGEAVNFAVPDWLSFGRRCADRYRLWQRPSPISRERLVMAMVSNLPELDLEGLQLLATELQLMRNEQERLRRKAYELGVVHAMQMEQEKEDDEHFDALRQCHVCRHLCYFSALVCSCSTARVVCMRHTSELCSCHKRENCALFWYTIQNLDEALEKVAAAAKALENGKGQ